MIRLVMFDADGTLYNLDIKLAYKPVYKYLARLTGKSVEEIEELHRSLVEEVKSSRDPRVRRYEYTFSRMVQKLGLKVTGEELFHIMKENLANAVTPIAGVREVLEKLKSEGKRLAIFTNTFPDMLEIKLNKAIPKWREIFDFVITPEETGEMKPSVKFYKLALERSETRPEEILVVGDSWEADLAPARELGLKTVLVSDSNGGSPDYTVTDIRELTDILKKLETRIP